MILVELDVRGVVQLHDPFFELGFRPVSGGYTHLPPTPTVESVMAVEAVTDWRRISRRGHQYDLGRFRHFVTTPSADPIVLLHDSDRSYLADGRHRLGAAWLAGRETLPALVAPCPRGVPWCA